MNTKVPPLDAVFTFFKRRLTESGRLKAFLVNLFQKAE